MYLHYLCINWAVKLLNNFIADLLVFYYLCKSLAVSFLKIIYSSFTCVLLLGNYLYCVLFSVKILNNFKFYLCIITCELIVLLEYYLSCKAYI